MECLVGICGRDVALALTDTTNARSITVMHPDVRKSVQLQEHAILMFSGEPGDAASFVEYVQRNVRLYGMRNGFELDVDGVAGFVRRSMADNLRSRPQSVNMILAGYDRYQDLPSLYWIDYLAAATKVPFCAHGYAQYLVLSLLDRHWHEDMSEDEVMELARMCVKEMETRFVGRFTGWRCEIIGKEGVREVKL